MLSIFSASSLIHCEICLSEFQVLFQKASLVLMRVTEALMLIQLNLGGLQVQRATAKYANEGTGLTINIILKDGESLQGDDAYNYRAGLQQSDAESGFNLEVSNAGQIGEADYFVNLSYSDQRSIVDDSTFDISISLDGQTFEPIPSEQITQNLVTNKAEQLALNGSLDYLFEHGGALTTQFFISTNKGADQNIQLLTVTNSFNFDAAEETDSIGDDDTYNLSFLYDSELDKGSWNSQLSYSKSEFDSKSKRRVVERGGLTQLPPTSPEVSLQDLTGVPFVRSSDSISKRKELILSSDLDWAFNERYKILSGLQYKRSDINLTDDSILSTVSSFELATGTRFGDTQRFNQEDLEKVLAIYIENEVELLDSLFMNVGARYELTQTDSKGFTSRLREGPDGLEEVGGGDLIDSDKDRYHTVTPSVLFRWNLSEDQSVRLSWTTAVDAPDLIERAGFEITPSLVTVGNPQLEDAKVTTTELGFDWRLGNQGVFGITAYRQNILNQIIPLTLRSLRGFARAFPILEARVSGIPSSRIDEETIQYTSFINSPADRRITGAELDFSLPMTIIGLPDLTLQSNLTYIEDVLTVENLDSNPTTYQVSYNVTLDYQYESWGFGVSYNDIGDDEQIDLSDFGLDVSKDFREASIDLFVKKDFDNFSINLAIENAFDAKESVLSENQNPVTGIVDSSFFTEKESEPQYILSLRGSF